MTPAKEPTGPALSEQIMVRISPDLLAALTADAKANGRNVSQSARFAMERYLEGKAQR